MSDSFIPIQDPDTTNSKLDAEQLTVGANTVLRERVQVSGDGATEIAAVQNTLPTTEMGLVVRAVGTYAEDAAHTTADPGFAMLAVRRDSAAAGSGTDGDYSTVNVDGSGRLWVNASGAAVPVTDNSGSLTVDNAALSVTGGGTESGALRVTVASDSTGVLSVDDNGGALTVDNAGTFAVQVDGSALTALQKIDDPVLVDDAAFTAATSSVMMAGFVFDDTTPDSVNEGDAGAARMSANRNLYTTIRDAAGNERGANVNASNQLSVSVDNTVTVGSHAVTNAGTFAVQVDGAALTALQLIDNLVTTEDTASANGDSGVVAFARRTASPANTSGADGDYEAFQISAGRLWTSATIDAALPAGANAIGKLAANSGVDIGDVDVTSVVPGTGATSLGKAVDSAAGGTDTGVAPLAVRDDSLSTLTPVEGDYVPLRTNSTGALWVQIAGGAGSGGTSAVDDAAFTVATDAGTPIMGLADETTPDSVDEGDVGVVRMTLTRALHVNLRDSSGTEVSVGGGTQYDEDTAHVSGDKLTMAGVVRADTAATLASADGDRTALIVDGSGRLHVNVGNVVTTNASVTNAGTFAVQVTSANIAGGATSLTKAEDAAHASGDVGVYVLAVRDDSLAAHSGTDGDYESLHTNANGALWTSLVEAIADDAAFTPGTSRVLPVGMQADETSADSVDEGDVGTPRMSLDRKQYVIAHNETSTIYQNGTARTPAFASIDAATSGDNTLLAAQGAGNKIRVHQLFLVSAGTVNVRFESGAGGTALTGQMNLVANTGFVLPYSPIGWFETAANTLLNLELSAAVSVDGNFAYTVVT